MNKFSISVVVVTRNEEARIGACLAALSDFDDIWVVDSGSGDKTCALAEAAGAQVVDYVWNGKYPKKRQWCLETLKLKYDWVFFVDADEIVTPELVAGIAALDFQAAGYFVRGRYLWGEKLLRFGLCNNKLALFDRRKVEFPVVDDLDLEGMGEIEGHYQPVLKAEFKGGKIGQVKAYLLHDAKGSIIEDWEERHLRYAAWEAGMNARNAWPEDPVAWRQSLKRVFRVLPFRGAFAFVHSYVWKFGFLDGAAGFDFARSRMRYYRMIANASRASRDLGKDGGIASSKPARS